MFVIDTLFLGADELNSTIYSILLLLPLYALTSPLHPATGSIDLATQALFQIRLGSIHFRLFSPLYRRLVFHRYGKHE